MDPERFIEVASHLAKPPKSVHEEAAFRGACGRAYYAAFGVARSLLVAAGFTVSSTGDAHREVVDWLKRSTDKDVMQCGSALGQLQSIRKSADYDVAGVPLRGKAFGKFETSKHVAKAQSIITTLRSARVRALSNLAITRGAHQLKNTT